MWLSVNLPALLLDMLDRAVHDAPEDKRHSIISQISATDVGDLIRLGLCFIRCSVDAGLACRTQARRKEGVRDPNACVVRGPNQPKNAA
jgi:hypothetical protein